MERTLADSIQSNLPQRVELMWDIRDQGDTPRCQEEYLNLCLDLGLNQTKPLASRICQLLDMGVNGSLTQEILLLEIAIWRGRLELDRADQALAELEKYCHEKMIPLSGRFQFQAGLNCLARQHFEKGSYYFSLAKRQSELRESESKISVKAYFNLILCLEVMGHDVNSHLKRFRSQFSRWQNEDWARPIRQQLMALAARTAFDHLNLEELRAIAKEVDPGQQVAFTMAFLSSLIWLCFPEGKQGVESLVEIQTEGKQNWLSQYRLNTIKGLLVTHDLKSPVKLDAKIERLYCWTHKWLRSPNEFGLNKVKSIVDNIGHLSGDEIVSMTTVKMLENSLRWIALFSGRPSEEVEGAVHCVNSAMRNENRLLSNESQLLDALFALRDGRVELATDSLKAIYTDGRPSHVDGRQMADQFISVFASALMNGNDLLVPEGLEILYGAFRPMLVQGSGEESNGIRLDMGRHKIQIVQNGEVTDERQSESLARLLLALSLNGPRSKDYLLSFCFGISGYDPINHDPKIANLISKANRVLEPYGVVRSSRGVVFLESSIENWSFLGTNAYSLQGFELYPVGEDLSGICASPAEDLAKANWMAGCRARGFKIT